MVSRALVSVLVGLNRLFAIGLFKRQIKKDFISKSEAHIPSKNYYVNYYVLFQLIAVEMIL